MRRRRRLLIGMGLSLTLAGCHLILGLTGADDRGVGSDAGASPTCVEYCDRIIGACTADERQYRNGEHCRVFCAQLERREESGLECRVSRLQDSANACSAVGPLGVGQPGCELEPCELYCDLMSQACPTTNLEDADGPTAADRTGCLRRCEVLDVSEYAVDAMDLLRGGDLNCRIQHINVALTFPEGNDARIDHCVHAAGRVGRGNNRPCGPGATGVDHSATH